MPPSQEDRFVCSDMSAGVPSLSKQLTVSSLTFLGSSRGPAGGARDWSDLWKAWNSSLLSPAVSTFYKIYCLLLDLHSFIA